MEIYSYLNMKQVAALKGEKTGINFPLLNKIRKPTVVAQAMRKVYLN